MAPVNTACTCAPEIPVPPVTRETVPLIPPEIRTVNASPLLVALPTVTTMFPVVACAGTVVVMRVLLQLVGVAAVPLNVTVLLPCVAPKCAP